MDNLAKFLNRNMPAHYRLDDNGAFWGEFDGKTRAATTHEEFNELKLIAREEFRQAEAVYAVDAEFTCRPAPLRKAR